MKLPAILILGAVAALATPALAQATADNNTSPQTAMNGTTANSGASTDSSSEASSVSSIPDTEKKYKNASRASDDQKEAETTKELNQQMANANGIPKTQQ